MTAGRVAAIDCGFHAGGRERIAAVPPAVSGAVRRHFGGSPDGPIQARSEVKEMLEILLAMLLVILLVGAMAVGVLLGRKPISGSCGGMAALGMQLECDICGGDRSKCAQETPADTAGGKAGLAYDASRPEH